MGNNTAPRYANNREDGDKKYVRIECSPNIKYLANHENTLIEINKIDQDFTLSVDPRFSKFGDVIKIGLEHSKDFRIDLDEGFIKESVQIFYSCFLEFIFDGNKFVSTISKDNGIGVGTELKSTTDGGLLYSQNGKLKQDSEHFYYDDKNKRLGIGNNAPKVGLSICGHENNGQIHVMNNDLGAGTSAIAFGKYGEEPMWLLGAGIGDDDLAIFSLYNTITGEKYTLSAVQSTVKEPKKTIKKTNN